MSLRLTVIRIWAVGVVAASAGILGGCGSAPAVYSSPQLAASALADATRSGSKEKLSVVLGTQGADVISSGDEVMDQNDMKAFVVAYDRQNEVVAEAGGSQTLLVGQDRWPFPVPIVNRDGGWRFDVEKGREEITNRRVGRNELNAINVCQAIVDAQHEYARQAGGDPQYAQKFVSDPGKRNGLFWPAADGAAPSPLGPLVAAATEEGYDLQAIKSGKSAYHGYRYRILTSQGAAAPGGARDYVIDGKMIGGFGVVAYPAEYGVTGVMTFITSHNGVVYQADLGTDTAKVAQAMTVFNPDSTWTKVAEDGK
ncbi:DUF2950 domain-containing protein [Humisphaera borealis]|uniref:DUF2950 domain-containing protein n=1 Tax=Humisphaera borealis TaxID=2807512 RepID=A0A7M2WVR5_9BACT|nr:DUF2950 domain-containing protein [Humisphaera borealis]QOV89479.1 DUF2950 domain-containing protein [Humisphaera borealis]